MPSADNTAMPPVTADRPYTHEMVIVHRVFRVREGLAATRHIKAHAPYCRVILTV
ncbi:hypothetical protein [Nonomuraea turkmeniaca]|uniref:hypothetical protein n=1 Tax=Nonomuraea turkmeniaca TaxID=103838 RepID=UPI001476F126|nr:hypothetical protein [Nonomuraea turkmeniaca]